MRALPARIEVENQRAVGVRLSNGEVIRANDVISNADYRVTKDFFAKGAAPELEEHLTKSWEKFPSLESFIHIHLGFKGEGLPESHCEEFPAQWGVFKHWDDLEAPRNAVLVSCPSMLDPELAPKGYHALHAYTPATEPWEEWKDLDPKSEAYKKKKEEARDFLRAAVAKQADREKG